MTRNPLEDARELRALELSDFLHYVVEVSAPVVSLDYDREILAAFEECYAAEQKLGERIVDLIIQLGGHPHRPGFSLDLSYYNFARADMLAEKLAETCKRDFEFLQQMKSEYEGCEDLEERILLYLIGDFIALREEFIKTSEKLVKGAARARAEVAAAAAGQEIEIEEEEEAPAAPAAGGDEVPWHNEDLELAERMGLAKSGTLFDKLYAAMAQTDCTACGYDCEGYARAIADGEDKDLGKCSPGEQDTQDMLESLVSK